MNHEFVVINSDLVGEASTFTTVKPTEVLKSYIFSRKPAENATDAIAVNFQVFLQL